MTAADQPIGPAGAAGLANPAGGGGGPARPAVTAGAPQAGLPAGPTIATVGARRTVAAIADKPATITAGSAVGVGGRAGRPCRAVDEQRAPRNRLHGRQDPEGLGCVDQGRQQVRIGRGLGGGIRTPARGQQLRKLSMKRRRLHAQRVKLLPIAAK